MSVLDRLRTGAWLDQQTFPPLAWAVPGVIPEGFGLLTGPPKAGKSWAALGVCLAVASGGQAFGRIPVGPPRPVLLLALEDGDRRLRGRCRTLLGPDVPIPVDLSYATTATPAEVLDLIGEWLAVNGARRPLVVLDTLGRVLPVALPGEGAYQRDYRVGARLKGTVDAHPGACLLVVHHVRKQAVGDGADWMDSTSGTNGLNGAADFTVNLSRARNDTAGVLRVTGRDVPEGEYAVTCDAGSWRLVGATLAEAAAVAQQARATADLGDRSAEIVAFVAVAGTATAAEVDASLGMSNARRYLSRLVDSGRLNRSSRGVYTPVPSVPLSQDGASLDSLGVSRVSRDWDNGTHGTGGPGWDAA